MKETLCELPEVEDELSENKRLRQQLSQLRKTFKCAHCGKAFCWQKNLHKHLQLKHPKRKYIRRNIKPFIWKPLKCSVCLVGFSKLSQSELPCLLRFLMLVAESMLRIGRQHLKAVTNIDVAKFLFENLTKARFKTTSKLKIHKLNYHKLKTSHHQYAKEGF